MESLCFRPPTALLGMSTPPVPAVGIDVRAPHHYHPAAHVAAAGRNAAAGTAVETSTGTGTSRQSYMFLHPLRRLWPVGGGSGRADERQNGAFSALDEEGADGEGEPGEGEEDTVVAAAQERENWVMKILRVRSILPAEDRKPRGRIAGDGLSEGEGNWADGDEMLDAGDRCVGCYDAEGSEGCFVGEEEEAEVTFDRESFSRLLRRVSLPEIRLFSLLSYLGSLAYNIPNLKIEIPNGEKKMNPAAHGGAPEAPQAENAEKGEKREQKNGSLIRAASAYQIAASAASYLQSQTWSILPFGSSRSEAARRLDTANSELTSFMATTDSVTAVVAAKEETKQAVAEDLNSAKSSPCEWFICDDDNSRTRFFVIQGSESLASWQANLLFEPIQFEGLDVLVHRGIYEAAKGIYRQMLPYVRDHLKSRGGGAAFRFTGHSLGGSLSLLVNLMLLIRGEVPASSLLPVVTFGAPSIMCGGDHLLKKLGLPRSHVQSVTMHRDIVPRAFSCNYPDHVAEILKALNGNFRKHPCLKHQKLLYAPMGELLILQPEEKFSPHHDLLPSGTGLYSVFLNSPHPLEILSDRAAYGAEGTVYRDHDVNAYLRSVRGVIHRELRQIRKAKREQRRQLWWPLVAAQRVNDASGQLARRRVNSGHRQVSFPGMLQSGSESLGRLGKLAVSRHVQVLLVLLLPAKLLILGALSIVPLG
ncbi:unnamed protein product [Spirodela intermedia]|uniref:Fungal lipase-type domain-containing protein n=1 Tax=Spirodela intermedia TaxID=51605 RepID=A0A7I8IA24_SPIIN|nr:unnamed protein product [Spirodela intermedia]CAA6654378.1 unnamed protein product [Spirodela intermedia]